MMETVSLETLRVLTEISPEALRALGEVPPETLRALRGVPPQALQALQAPAGELTPEVAENGWTGDGDGELPSAIDHVIELMSRSPVNVVGSFGQYLSKGQNWTNIYIDSGGGGV